MKWLESDCSRSKCMNLACSLVFNVLLCHSFVCMVFYLFMPRWYMWMRAGSSHWIMDETPECCWWKSLQGEELCWGFAALLAELLAQMLFPANSQKLPASPEASQWRMSFCRVYLDNLRYGLFHFLAGCSCFWWRTWLVLVYKNSSPIAFVTFCGNSKVHPVRLLCTISN